MEFELRQLDKSNFEDYYRILDLMSNWQLKKSLAPETKKRLYEDCFGSKKKFEGLIAYEKKECVGLASFFEIYSTFAAKSVLWIDDIFVVEKYRTQGIGKKIFIECIKIAKERDCDRAEWHVFGEASKKFYETFGAKDMTEHSHYRLDSNQFNNVLKKYE